MNDAEEKPFPKWDDPATKGDVIRAMVYCQALSSKLLAMSVALSSKDTDKIARAFGEYSAESDELTRTIDEISGRIRKK